MIVQLTASFLADFLPLIASEKGFWALGVNEREAAVRRVLGEYPDALVAYMAHVKHDVFWEDVQGALTFLQRSEDTESSTIKGIKKNGLLNAMKVYFMQNFPAVLDQFDSAFFFEPDAVRDNAIMQAFPKMNATLHRALKHFLFVSTQQEITESVQSFLEEIYDAPMIVVQSAVAMKPELKQKVRAQFAEKYPSSFLAFHKNPQIIGGLRVLVDGTVEDHSWLSRIQRISHIKHTLLTS